MDRDRLRQRLGSAAAWLDASVVETVGLACLLAGGLLVVALVWWQSQPRDVPTGEPVVAVPTADATPTEDATGVVVHVTGAVARPGLVELPAGSRVADAIGLAGGAAAQARLDAVNLARVVVDGEQLHVPSVGEDVTAPAGTTSGGVLADGTVDLNRATAAELESLPGVGPVLAQRIVDHRTEHGPFADPGGLREVSGIGERTFQALADLVVVR